MSKIKLSTWIIIAGYICLIPQSVFASDDQIRKKLQRLVQAIDEKSKTDDDTAAKKRKSGSSDIELKKKKATSPAGMPAYRPPLRGAPVGRIAGGTRGIVDEYPSLLCVLTPDDTALTVRGQPRLYWFLRQLTEHPIELTIIEDQAIYPLLETRLSAPRQPGIHSIRLADHGVNLQQGVVYKWFIAIIPDPNRRSKDILAWGAVRQIEISDKLKAKLSDLDKVVASNIYAAAGIWYDAFAEISALIEISPHDLELRKKRNALLEQIGFSEIAQYEIKDSAGSYK